MSESPFEAKLKAAYGDVYEGRKPFAAVSAVAADSAPMRSESVVQLQEKVITINVYVLGINIEYNEPDIFVTQVTCTEQEYYEEGLHLIMAEERAKQNGFVDPLFSFDERETGVIEKLGKLFGKP
jgi:hypothetical protein